MTTLVDFDEWSSAPGFTVKLQGGTYEVPPRSLDDWRLCVVAAALGEHNLGLRKSENPEELRERLAEVKPGDHPALGPVYDQMITDGIPPALVDRVAYYGVFLIAKSKRYADLIASFIWSLDGPDGEASEPAPKG